jgi:hypothetical protein
MTILAGDMATRSGLMVEVSRAILFGNKALEEREADLRERIPGLGIVIVNEELESVERLIELLNLHSATAVSASFTVHSDPFQEELCRVLNGRALMFQPLWWQDGTFRAHEQFPFSGSFSGPC